MRTILWMLMLLAAPALAELPALTPSQQEKLKKEEAAQKAMLQRELQAVARAQERVARQYRGGSLPKVQEEVTKADVPKSATQPLRTPGEPHAGRETMPQAEAHSQSTR